MSHKATGYDGFRFSEMGKQEGGEHAAMSVKQYAKQKILIAFGVAIILTLLMLLALSGGNLALLKSLFIKDLSNEQMKELLSGFGWRGYVVIAALSMLQVVCTFLPAEPVQVLAGVTFPFAIGLTCCMVGVLLGNTLIYMLQKTFGDQLRRFFVKKLNLDPEKIARSSKATLIIFILYFLPAIPYGMICFLAASLGMSYRRYITATTLGALPSVCIGVGLGHMAMMSDWIVTVCVFSILFVLIGVMFRKRDTLFAKLNGYADRHKAMPANRVRPVNGFIMGVLYYVIRAYLFLCGVRLKTTNKVGALQAPSLVLCNHGSFIDFIYAAALLRRYKPHFIVARLYFYHRVLGWLLRRVGAFPKSMFAMDVENAKNCLSVLKSNEILSMMPEARLSTTGRFEDIQDSTYSFIKKAGVNVYTIKICGDYLADPKWGKGFRRGSLVEAELDLLFTAKQVKALPLEQLQRAVEERLTYNEFEWLQQRPAVRYRCKKIAQGLENILTTCPICGRKYTIVTKKDQVLCEHCGYLTSVNDRYGFDAELRFSDLTQWYDWQKLLLEQEIAEREDYVLSSEVELRLRGNGNALTRHSGVGVCTLNRDGLTYVGTKDGETVELHYSMHKIYRLLFGAGVNFELYDGTEILFFVPKEKRSAVEWYMASVILHDTAEQAAQKEGLVSV